VTCSAHLREAMDLMVFGLCMSAFHASQQASTIEVAGQIRTGR